MTERERAEAVVDEAHGEWCGYSESHDRYAQILVKAITTALTQQRDRDARVAEDHDCDSVTTDDGEKHEHCGEAELCGSCIATAIRGQD